MATGLYANEKVKSVYRYPNSFRVKSLTEQLGILCRFFPELGDSFQSYAQTCPPEAEGQFVIPKWNKVALSYGEAVCKVLALIWSTREVYNYLRDQVSEKYLRPHARIVEAFQKEEMKQKGNILIFPAQFGMYHKGHSVRCARAVFGEGEFGLGIFAVGCMLLTHPERFDGFELWIDCAGDEFFSEGDSSSSATPVFRFDENRVELAHRWSNDADGSYGSATGFLF